ncbi:hypothetical protein TWF718_002227 [Orbilia javanica]|uniref:Uncharacterized protein n=1 Tax=Orbilia javanica TaxID=47235 RepID=A0AAN8R8K9_9PEZI
MIITPEPSPGRDKSTSSSPRFSTPDFWNETGEEIQFTQWEQGIITITEGDNIKPTTPKQPRKTGGWHRKTNDLSNPKTPIRSYKSRCRSKAPPEAGDPMESNLARKPRGKRVLPSPETLRLTRFKPIGHMDPIEKAASNGKATTELTKLEKAKKLGNKKNPPPKGKMPLPQSKPTAPINTTSDKPGKRKRWFEDIDEDLLKGTKWARELNQNSLQREHGNPGVLPEDRKKRKTHNNTTVAKQKITANAKDVSASPLQPETRKETDQPIPSPMILDSAPSIISKPTDTASAYGGRREATINQNTPRGFEFENQASEDVPGRDLGRPEGPVISAREDGKVHHMDLGNISIKDYSGAGVGIARKPIAVAQDTSIDKPTEAKTEKQVGGINSFSNFSFDSFSELDFGILPQPIDKIQKGELAAPTPGSHIQGTEHNNVTLIDVDSTAMTRIPKTCLPAPERTFDRDNNRNDPEQVGVRLGEPDGPPTERNGALMHQMKPATAGTPFIDVPKTQIVPGSVKDAKTDHKKTRSVAGSAKKRGRSDTEEDVQGSKRRNHNTGKPGLKTGEVVDRANSKKGKELVPEAAKMSKNPRGRPKRARKEKTKEAAATIGRALTQQEAKSLARQNPGKQFVFDLDDEPQN